MTGSWASKKIFFLGVKGVMMSNLALFAYQMGKEVCGSDTAEPQITDENLQSIKLVPMSLGEDLPSGVDLVVFGAAHGGASAPQVLQALERKIPTITQGQFIADLIKQFPKSVAVSGCHGKTSTTSMLAYAMHSLGLKVSWLIGAPHFRGIDTSGESSRYEGGKYTQGSDILVFEADEYGVCPPEDNTPKILLYHPTHIICTNIDFDHPDIYRDLAHVRNTFLEFFTHSKYLYECNSNSLEGNKTGIYKCLKDFGFDEKWSRSVLNGFVGVARRLDYYGEKNGVKVFDDYGHHPTEISATVQKLREMYPDKRLIMIFQSHTHSRTQALKNEFVTAFSLADATLIDAIFPSAREAKAEKTITSIDLANMAKEKGYSNIYGFEKLADLEYFLYSIVKKGDLILTIGAGDIYKIIPALLKRLENL